MDRWSRVDWRVRVAVYVVCLLAVLAWHTVYAAECEWRGAELWCDGEHIKDMEGVSDE